MRNHLINLHTANNSKPIGLLKLGELAIQHISDNPSDCRIYIDTATDTASSSENTIVEFIPKSYVDKEVDKLLKFIQNPELINYSCLDGSLTPIVVNDGYVFDSGVTEITPCTYDLSNITTLDTANGAVKFPSGLTSIVANMESLETTKVTSYSDSSFYNSRNSLTDVDIYLPNLTDGYYMFNSCSSLTSWDIPLPNLTNGYWMFYGCTGLTSFTSDLSSLTDGSSMFSYCSGLTSWDIPLPNLTDGGSMFYNCSGLTSWDIELPNLTTGYTMFYNCSGLTNWDIPLPNLTNGVSMFSDCSGLTSWDKFNKW